MAVIFCFLVRKPLLGPYIDIGGHMGPDNMGRNEAVCGLESRMAKAMHVVKNLLLVVRGTRGRKTGWKVTKERQVFCDRNGGDGKGRGFLEGKDRRAGFLFHVGGTRG
jgi:hypothetical protein